MTELLKLYFDKNNDEQYISISSCGRDFDTITLFDFVKVKYNGGLFYSLTEDEISFVIKEQLIPDLTKVINNELFLDESIKKSLGYYQAKYYNREVRKDLKYEKRFDGELTWVGRKYELFDPTGYVPQVSFLYNDEQGNIWFELSPVYPGYISFPQEGETLIKYSQWLKEFRPYVVRQISREVAQEWVEKLEKLLKTVEANDKRLSCTGPGCKLCKQEGSEVYKQFCGDCKDCEKIHNES